MNSIIGTLLETGRLRTLRTVDSGTFSDGTQDHREVVPAGVRWWILGGIINRDQNSTVYVKLLDSSDNTIEQFEYQGAGTGVTAWPSMSAQATQKNMFFPTPAEPGEQVQFSFGAAQGAAGVCVLRVIEVPL